MHICIMTPLSRALSLACTFTCARALSVTFLYPSHLSLSSRISLSHMTLTSLSHDSIVPPHTSLPHLSHLSPTHVSHIPHISHASLLRHTHVSYTHNSLTHTCLLRHTHYSPNTHISLTQTFSLTHTHLS